MAKNLPNLRQGDDYTLKIKYPSGTDITGFKFYLTLKTSFDDPDAAAILQSIHIAGSGLLDEPLIGVCFMTIPSSVTVAVEKGNYYYDLQAVSTSGAVETLAPPLDDYRHKISVIPTITQATA